MSAVRSQVQIDADLEAEIDAAYEKMIHAPTDEGSKVAFREMTQLIARRSPHQVHKMELERRIAMRQAKA